MKRVIIALTAVTLASGISYGKGEQNEPGPNFENLKCYRPMIGAWRYEGPLLEDVSDFAQKGTKFVFQLSWKWILNRNVVEENWSIEFEGGKKVAGKALIGWNGAENRLAYGGMDSVGGMGIGTLVFDSKAKTSTLTEKGIDGDGEETFFEGVVTKTGKDTLTWQALHRTGGIVEGPSPKYTFERVKRARQPKRLKQAK